MRLTGPPRISMQMEVQVVRKVCTSHLHTLPALAILPLDCIATAPPYTAPPTTPAVTADCTSTPTPTKKEGAQSHGLSAASLVLLAPAHPRHPQSHSKTPSPTAKERRIPRKPLPAFLEHEIDGEVRVSVAAVESPARAVYVQAPWGAERWWWWRATTERKGSPHPLRALRIAVPWLLCKGGAAAAGGARRARAGRGVRAGCACAVGYASERRCYIAGTAGVAFETFSTEAKEQHIVCKPLPTFLEHEMEGEMHVGTAPSVPNSSIPPDQCSRKLSAPSSADLFYINHQHPGAQQAQVDYEADGFVDESSRGVSVFLFIHLA
ncbi:hypothetical protein B0H11DRAFT_2249102 [Mycena galericulata]|nr:hypothetical protein B0H11DRAFT_2249102 [Mycena galericulata]